ncbi:MAG: hypothetical protein WBE61_02110 [Nitrososphaeraceae archaeon]
MPVVLEKWFVVTYATSFCHDGLFRPYRGMQLRITPTTKMARGGLDKGKLTKEKKSTELIKPSDTTKSI